MQTLFHRDQPETMQQRPTSGLTVFVYSLTSVFWLSAAISNLTHHHLDRGAIESVTAILNTFLAVVYYRRWRQDRKAEADTPTQ